MVCHPANFGGLSYNESDMDSTSKTMYDALKDEIWEELGPLDPNWFDALTVKADEENVSEQDNLHTFNQDRPFKAPFEKTAVDSQLFSTPKIFRHSRVKSPETGDEQVFSAEQETERSPWTVASPCLFGTAKEGMSEPKSYGHMQFQNGFALLDTPQKTSVDFAQHISESLGAQIHPDISWTSSLNTPPAVPSTLILSKNEESPCPVSLSAEKNVIFVRKLFPSLTNDSGVPAVSPNKSEVPSAQQAVDSPGPGQDRNSHESTESSLNQSNSDWKQTLPDAIEDGEIRSTVAHVLDGAENVLSIFFTNSSSALRRVKTDRIKRKQSFSTKDHSHSSTNILTTNNVAPSERTAEQRSDDLEVSRVPSSPHLKSQVKAGNSGNTQWSPLSLSEISHCAMDTTSQIDAAKQIGSSVTAEQLGSDSVCGLLVRPSLINTDSMFTKKKRRFVYTIQSTKSQLQGKDMSAEMESSPGNPVLEQELYVTRMENAPDNAQCYNRSKQSCDGIHEMQKQENVAKEYLSPSVPTKSQDLDMSQLCRAFAQDFTPVPDSSKLSKVEDTQRNGFSPSACLSALRQRNKQKSDERVLHLDRNGISDKGNMPSTYLRKSKIDSTVSDSGFQSFMADVTPMTASSSVLPSIERDADSQPWPGFKTEIHRTAPFESATKEKGIDNMNRPVAAAELSTRVIEQSQTVDLGTETSVHTEGASSSAKAIVIERNCIQQNCQVPASVQPQTVSVLSVHASGFKTASNKGVKVSKVNLERAKNLFKEINAETPIGHQPTRCSRNTEDEADISHISVESISNSNHPPSSSGKCGDLHCPLTASQKADVTELCSLLEEADSQFEFTQFRTAKQNQHSKDNASLSQTADKDLDPDFLSGIDFDDSFSSDAEKLVAKTMTPNKVTSISHCKMDCTAPSIKSKSSGTSLCNVVKKENPSSGHAFSRHMSEGLAGTAPTKLQSNFNIAGQTEAVKPENKNPSVFGVGFKTARGNTLKVSNKYLSKARALFADLEENPLTISDTGDSSDIVTTNTEEVQNLPHQQKNCEISVKANHQHNVDNSTHNGDFLHSKEDSKFTGNHDLNTQERIQVCFSDVPESPCLDRHVPDIRTAEHATKMSKLKNNKMDTSSCQSGFQMASGKGISVCAKAIQEANAFFKDCVAIDSDDCMSKHKKHITLVTGMVRDKKNISNFKGVKVNICNESVNGSTAFENVDAGTFAKRHKEDEQILSGGYKNTLSLTNSVSFNGRPSLMAKQSSSLLYTSSKDVGFSNNGELSNDKGFCTASGKKVSVSDDAVTQAKSLLSECHTFEDRSKHQQTADLKACYQTSPIPTLPPQNGGFQTASGKGVAVSAMALKKAQALLSEYDGVEDEKEVRLEVRPIPPNNPNADPPPRNNGFCTASGKKVSVSDDAMTKAKSLLSECHTFEDRSKHQQTADLRAGCQTSPIPTLPPQNGGFQTASGKGVAVSAMALKKAQALLSEYDGVEDEKEVRLEVRPIPPNNPNADPPPRNNGFCTANGKKVSVSDDAMTKAKSLLNEYEGYEGRNQHQHAADLRAGCQTSSFPALPPQNGGFQTASGKGVAISTMALKKAQALLSEYDGVEDEKEVRPIHPNNPICDPPPKDNGFCTASGKKVTVSDDAVTKAKSRLNEYDEFEDRNQHKQRVDTVRTHHFTNPVRASSLQNGGFQTASGKGVAVSAMALKKAKTLLSDYDGVENEKELLPINPNTPIHEPLPRNGGFSAASGKPVAFSAKALQKAEALFSDINSTTETPAVSDTWNTDSNHEDASKIAEKIHCTFTTARGTKVNVSEKNLLKAKNLLNEFVDAECPDSEITPRSYSASSFDIHKSDIPKVNICKITSTSDLNTTSQKDMPFKEIVPQVVTTLLSEADLAKEAFRNSTEGGYSLNAASGKSDFVSEKAPKEASRFQEGTGSPSGQDNLQVMPGEERPVIMDCGVNQTSSSETHQFIRMDGSSVLNFESLDISNCTDTQQLFFAQEAMDCTKALLEDEDLAGQSRNMISEKLPLHDNPKSSKESGETQKTSGKRSAVDSDMTGQPPLKRRLLEEFDRTVDSQRGSTLLPAKCCPDGVTADRRVFKYSVSHHPNITRPHGDGKPYMETGLQKTEPLLSKPNPTPGESGPLHSKMAVFVPPFQKKVKTQTVNSNVPKNKARAPVFVPPFKKQRTAVTESSPLRQTTEDKCHHLHAMPPKTNTCVPPNKTSKILTEEIDSQGNEDTQTMTLVDSGSLQSGENPPVGHGKKYSVAEASDRLSTNQEMITNFELARDMQDMRIRKKKRQTIRPLSGSLFLAKTSGVDRIRLKDAVNGQPPAQHTQKQLYGYGVHRHVTKITSDTAESFRFSFQQFFKQEVLADRGGVQLADGGWLIPRNDGTAGKEEFYRALCDSPGVDPKLISEDWVYNHYRWIVWKQASMERSFPATMAGLRLNPEQVLLQLKYRYDVEVDHSRRPALRKIMEKDDTAAKTLVLCVCGVISRGHDPSKTSRNDIQTPQGADSKVENPVAVVWLTDGWYAIKAQLDVPLTAKLHKGRLAIGGKLIIHGAELVGSQDACSPLEAPESVMLKICANSSRPARWDTKLGFHRDPRPFLLPVSCLYSNGGTVGCVDIVILRSYPIQWMERKPDGGFVFRCDRAEEKEARRYNNSKHKAMEILSAKIQAEFEKEDKGNNKPRGRRRTLSRQDIENLQDGEELHEAVENDPAYLEARLSEQQLETLHSYRRSLAEKKQAELQERYRRALDDAQESELNCPKRDVTPVWRLCIADSRDHLGSGVCLLNIWRPSTDLQSYIKEGCRYRVYNLTTSDGKRRAGFTSVQLTATKKTQFQDLQASQEWLSAHFLPRISVSFLALQNPEFHPLCGEVDLVGHVIAIIDGRGSFPVLYLVDGKLKFVKVHCCSSLAQTGLEDVVKPLALLALSNLQLRAQSSSPVPTLYAGDLTVFSTNPKEAHLQEAVTQLRNLVQEHENFFTIAEESLSHFVRSDSLSSIPSPALQPRTPGCRTDRKPDTRTSVTSQQRARSFGSFTPLSRKPPPANSSSEKDPKLLKRRRALEYLSRVSSPPPLSHLGTAAASPCVNKTFNPPRRSGTASTLKTVQTPVRKPVVLPPDHEWVNDEELAMIDTQALHGGDLSRQTV